MSAVVAVHNRERLFEIKFYLLGCQVGSDWVTEAVAIEWLRQSDYDELAGGDGCVHVFDEDGTRMELGYDEEDHIFVKLSLIPYVEPAFHVGYPLDPCDDLPF